MNFLPKVLIGAVLLFFLLLPRSAFAVTIASQTQSFSDQIITHRVLQELGNNLSGIAGSFTFRVSTAKTNLNQFNYTIQNTRIFDKDNNNSSIVACAPPGYNPNDTLGGLVFNTVGVPAGFEDVTLDFSCHNYSFIPGHRYLIVFASANYNSGSGLMLLAAGAYGSGGTSGSVDQFTGGGLRYSNGNIFDIHHGGGSCSGIAYIWNGQIQNPTSGCNIWTSAQDDLYFILTNTTPEPSPTPTPVPSKIPLILIPGIGGSELKVNEDTFWSKDDGHGGTFNHTYAMGEKVWVNEGEAANPGEDDYFDVLRMKTDGVTSEANVTLTGNLYAGAYQGAIDFFTSNGYTLNQDLFVFPYDWRKDIALTASALDSKINQIKSQTGSAKVDIVAHSMGGLVARNYIADASRAQNVRKLFTLGTPHLGATEFIKFLRYGGCFTKPELQNMPFCIGLEGLEVKDVIQNMIAGFQLAPSQTYFNFYSDEDHSHPYPYRTEAGSLNYLQIKNLLTSFEHNTALFTASEALHTLDNSLSNTNDVEVTIIAGSGQPTLGQIIELTLTTLNGNTINFKDRRDINGDGTVPLLSASISDPHKSLFINGPAKVYYTNQEHGGLVSDGPSLNLVRNIIEGNKNLPADISETPYKMVGHELSVHSPVNIHVYDTNGNHTGPTPSGDFEVNIPGSSYDTLGDAKFIYLPENGVYDIKFEATGNGSFDFKIRKFENDENTKTVLYNDIPLTDNTKAETEFDTTLSQPPTLQIDQDGNGTTDATVSSTSTLTGNAVDDLTAPQTEIQLSGTAGSNSWYKSDVTVTLNAQDEENGSGILKTEYTLDGQTINTYTDPFTLSTEGITKLKVKSLDNAGNEEEPKAVEIKIDKTAPEAKVFIDPDKLDMVVDGIDSNPTTVSSEPNSETKKKDDIIYAITDIAGNKTWLDVRERDKEKKDRFRIHSIKYNEENPIELPNNHFNVSYNGKKDKLNVKEQNFELKKEVKIRIKYDSKKNKSTIIIKEPKEERVKEVRDGLVLLKLQTSKGLLETSY